MSWGMLLLTIFTDCFSQAYTLLKMLRRVEFPSKNFLIFLWTIYYHPQRICLQIIIFFFFNDLLPYNYPEYTSFISIFPDWFQVYSPKAPTEVIWQSSYYWPSRLCATVCSTAFWNIHVCITWETNFIRSLSCKDFNKLLDNTLVYNFLALFILCL